MGRKKGPPGKSAARAALPPPALPDDAAADVDFDDDDIAFVQSHRRQLQRLANAQLEEALAGKRRKKRVDDEEVEEAYERAPRLGAEWEAKPAAAAAVDSLPTKAADGSWVYKSAEAAQVEPGGAPVTTLKSKRARDAVDGAERGTGAAAPKRQQAAGGSAEQPMESSAALAFEQLQEQELSLSQKKERIAAACAALLEAPERNVSELKILHRLALDGNVVVARLASLSAMLVYKDLAPGYRIRPPTDKELEMAVSKEVRATRDYETAFLKAYQSFLQLLLSAAGSADGASESTAKKGSTGALDKRTALRCMCGLLQALPQFNYRSDLLRALVPRLASSDPEEANMVNEALEAVLAEDNNGESTLETVQLIADLVKRRACDAPPCALHALKSVRFDDSLGARLKDEREKGKPLTQKQRNRKWIEERRRLRDEAKNAARKPDAKASAAAAPEDDLDDRTLREFDALPDVNSRLELQTSTLEAVCEIYFRVLKDAAAPEHVAGRPLLGETFAGLARVAHLIDYEVVADILEVLRKLLAKGGLNAELRARCLLAACDVLGGQGAALTVDTRDFHRHLYGLAEVPPSVAASISWADSRSQAVAGEAGRQASTLWARSLSTMLLARSHRQVDTERVAAFAKRLSAVRRCTVLVAFHAETGEAMGALAVISELLNRHQKLRRLLENESGAARSYMPDITEPESACALSSCLWEVSLLQRHVHPSVAALATHVACLPVEDAAPPAPYGASTVEEVTAAFSTACGGFKPAVPAPKPGAARRSTRESRQAAFERVLKLSLAAPESEPAGALGLRALFRETRAFQENEALRAQAGQLRSMLAQRSQAFGARRPGAKASGRKKR